MFGRSIAAATLLLLAACERAPREPRVTVENAVVTVPAVPTAPGAAYFTLHTNNEPTRLVSVSSPFAARIELHETIEANRMSRMMPLDPARLGFSPSEPLVFASGGRHAMLFEVDPNLRPGGHMTLTFTFEGAPPVSGDARLVAPGAGHSAH